MAKAPNVKEIVQVIDSRITAQKLNIEGYAKLLAMGNQTHSATYRERMRRSDAIIKELSGLREFINPTPKEEAENGQETPEATDPEVPQPTT